MAPGAACPGGPVGGSPGCGDRGDLGPPAPVRQGPCGASAGRVGPVLRLRRGPAASSTRSSRPPAPDLLMLARDQAQPIADRAASGPPCATSSTTPRAPCSSSGPARPPDEQPRHQTTAASPRRKKEQGNGPAVDLRAEPHADPRDGTRQPPYHVQQAHGGPVPAGDSAERRD